MSDTCPRCGALGYHYMTHLCADCTCRAYPVRIPGEPHIPPYLDAELDPDCPAHGDHPTPATTGHDTKEKNA